MRRVLAVILPLMIVLLCGCGKEKNLKGFEDLLSDLDSIDYVTEHEGDYVYVVDSKENIEEIKRIIVDSIDKPIRINMEELGEFPIGGYEVSFYGTNGIKITMYINDTHFKYDMVCTLFRNNQTEVYCYDLKSEIFSTIKTMTHHGECKHITNPIK